MNTVVGYRLDVDFQLVTTELATLQACFGSSGDKFGRLVHCLSMGHRIHVMYLNTEDSKMFLLQYIKINSFRDRVQQYTFRLWDPLGGIGLPVTRDFQAHVRSLDTSLSGDLNWSAMDGLASALDDEVDASTESEAGLRFNGQLFLLLPTLTPLLQPPPLQHTASAPVAVAVASVLSATSSSAGTPTPGGAVCAGVGCIVFGLRFC